MTTADTTSSDASQKNPTEEATPCPFNIGEVTFLKGFAEPPLTVEGMFTHPQDPGAWIIAVVWFDHERHLQHAQFHPSALDKELGST